MSAYAALRARLDAGAVVVLDGPMGSELVRRGVRWRQHGLRTDADAVQALHREYLDAGADILRTNTFQLNRRTYQGVFRDPDHMRHIGAPGLERRVPELIPKAVSLAQSARADARAIHVPLAGVISPLEHCFRPDLAPSFQAARSEHAEITNILASAGVDFLMLESMNTVTEARAAVEAASATGLPVWVSFVIDEHGALLSGEPLREALTGLEVDAVLVNCAPPEDISVGLKELQGHVFGAYAHIGRFDPPSWKFEFVAQFSGTEAWPPDRYANTAAGWIDAGARIVGGCCGTTAEHVRALKALVAGVAA
jgi:S-methylmethionine-dependent homocysteine/selenocysteine methylase